MVVFQVSPIGSTCLFWLAYALFFDAPRSVESLWTSDRPVAETSTWQHITFTTDKQTTSMSPMGFKPTISAGERPESYALNRAATGNGKCVYFRSLSVMVLWRLWLLGIATSVEYAVFDGYAKCNCVWSIVMDSLTSYCGLVTVQFTVCVL